jgi:enoyl-CoA hydratase/carnithine racemase
MMERLAEAFETLSADPQCRVILLRGRGGHFCAGRARLEREGDRLDLAGVPALAVKATLQSEGGPKAAAHDRVSRVES